MEVLLKVDSSFKVSFDVSMLVAISASMKDTAWLAVIGFPNCTRFLACSKARPYAPRQRLLLCCTPIFNIQGGFQILNHLLRSYSVSTGRQTSSKQFSCMDARILIFIFLAKRKSCSFENKCTYTTGTFAFICLAKIIGIAYPAL